MSQQEDGHSAPHQHSRQPHSRENLLNLPEELLLLVGSKLVTREQHAFRTSCRSVRDTFNKTADTLTLTPDIAQFLLGNISTPRMLHGSLPTTSAGKHAGTIWLESLLSKLPGLLWLSVKCSAATLILFSRRLLECTKGVALATGFADHLKSMSRRHAAILLCEVMKHHACMNRFPEALELVDQVNKLQSNRLALNQDGFKYARDTLDEALVDCVCVLQWRNGKKAAEFAKKIKTVNLSASAWRWLFYFLAKQRHAECAIEGYKVVDKAALQVLSPTCVSELFRTLIDNEIENQAEDKLRALTSESGSWTKFMYRGTFSLTSTQSREGALEKVCCELLVILYLDTVVTIMNKMESDDVAHQVWLQLCGVQGVRNGQELMAPPQHANPRPGVPLSVPHAMLVLKPREGGAHTAVERLLQLAAQVIPSRQAQAYGEIIKVYVHRGDIPGAIRTAELVPDNGADTALWQEFKTVFALDQCLVPVVPASRMLITQTTVQLLTQVVSHLKKTEVRAEANLYLVRIQLQRGNTPAALLAATAMEGGSPAEEQAAWAAICLSALSSSSHSAVLSCLTHLRGQTLLHGSTVLGGGPLWGRICTLLATVSPQAEHPMNPADNGSPSETAASSPTVSVKSRGPALAEPPETPSVTSSLAVNRTSTDGSHILLAATARSAADIVAAAQSCRSKRLRGTTEAQTASGRKAPPRCSPSSSQAGCPGPLPAANHGEGGSHVEAAEVAVEVEEPAANGSSDDDADYDSRLLRPKSGVQHPAVAQLLHALSVVVAREPSDPSFRDSCIRVLSETMLLHGFVDEACALACTSTSADATESVLHKVITHHLSLSRVKLAAAAARRLVLLGRTLSMEALAGLLLQLQASNSLTDAFNLVELIKPGGLSDESADAALTKLARALLSEGRLPQALSVAQVLHGQAGMNLVLDAIARKALSKDLAVATSAASLINNSMPIYKLSCTWRDIAKKAITSSAFSIAENAIRRLTPDYSSFSDQLWKSLALAYGRSKMDAQAAAAVSHIADAYWREDALSSLKHVVGVGSAVASPAAHGPHHTTRGRGGSPRS